MQVIALEGNGARPSHMGKGFSEDETMYTLNTIEQHSICYSIDCRMDKIMIDNRTVCYSVNQYAEYVEKLPILRASGGDTGGGGEALIVSIRDEQYESISKNNGSIMCEQPSGELHWSGCIQ